MSMPLDSTAARGPARGAHGVVVSHNVEASLAGAAVLREGGSAIDAAIAMSFVAATREVAMSGIGGAGVMLAQSATTGDVTEVNFYGRTPAALPDDVFVPFLLPPSAERMEFGWRGTRDDVSQRGFLAVGVPAFVAGLAEVHHRLASMPWDSLLDPAVRLAEGGFALDEEDAVFLAVSAASLERMEEARRIFMPDGLRSALLEKLRQPDLAATLGQIAAGGARSFYEGELAERMAAHVQANGGFLSASDLRSYRPSVGPGLRGRYGDFEVVTASGAMGGVTLLEMLNLAEELELGSLAHNSGPYLHLLAELIRQAWVDRFAYLGDPEAEGASPIDALVDKRYARGVATGIPTERAAAVGRPGDPWPFSDAPRSADAPAGGDGGGTHTTSLAAADRAGNVATFTQTLGQCYGSCVAAPGTGALLYDITYWFNPEPGSPSSVGPWKRPSGHATPVILRKDGEPVLAMGAPGGRKIVTAMLQVILNVVDFGMNLQEAIASPRLHLEGADPVDPSGPALRSVAVDARMPREAVEHLQARGHEVTRLRDSATRIHFGRPLGVEFRSDHLLGGVDINGKSLGCGV
jgi:gamma-glutamyltranspeptidase / glutathione hydrolase